MPDFNLDHVLCPSRRYLCPDCGSRLQVVRAYTAEDFADVTADGEVVRPVEFEIVSLTGMRVVCRQSDEHVLDLTNKETDTLIEAFTNL